MLRLGKAKVAKEEFYSLKMPIKIYDVNVDNIVISKLVETKNSCKYLIGYFVKVIRPLVLLLPKMSGYIKDKDGDENKNNRLMYLCVEDDKLLKKIKKHLD